MSTRFVGKARLRLRLSKHPPGGVDAAQIFYLAARAQVDECRWRPHGTAELLQETGGKGNERFAIDPDAIENFRQTGSEWAVSQGKENSMIDDLSFHDARHVAITRLAQKLTVLELAQMVGHRDLNMIQIYYNETDHELAKKLGVWTRIRSSIALRIKKKSGPDQACQTTILRAEVTISITARAQHHAIIPAGNQPSETVNKTPKLNNPYM